MWKNKLFSIWMSLLLSSSFIYAQDDDLVTYMPDESLYIDSSELVDAYIGEAAIVIDTVYKNRYRGEDFDYNEKRKDKKKKEPPKQQSSDGNFKVDFGDFSSVLMNGFIIIAVLALIFLIYKAATEFDFSRNKNLKPIQQQSTGEKEIEKIEEDIENHDIKSLIMKAKNEKKYALAIRYHFLYYLQNLQKLEIIKYHKDKTNAEYIMEVENPSIRENFIRVAYMFEFAWYGKKKISEAQFLQIEKLFELQTRQIK